MAFTKFCPKCGKDTDRLVKGLCKDCYLKGKDLFFLKEVSIDVCRRCGKIRPGFKWVPKTTEEIEEGIKSKVRPIPELEQPKKSVEAEENGEEYKVKIKVAGLLEGVVVEQEKQFDLALDKIMCDACMRLSSDYSEAIIQLRTQKGPETMRDMLEMTARFLNEEKARDSLSGVSKMSRTKNGFDLWIGSKKAASRVVPKLVRNFSAEKKVSKKLIGMEGGKDKYRHTFLIRV